MPAFNSDRLQHFTAPPKETEGQCHNQPRREFFAGGAGHVDQELPDRDCPDQGCTG
jgi:hypothetical protein